jgi:hypothetical protein
VARHQNLGFWQGEIHDRRKDGTLLPFSPVDQRGARHARTDHPLRGGFSDITERKASERIAYLAQHDP